MRNTPVKFVGVEACTPRLPSCREGRRGRPPEPRRRHHGLARPLGRLLAHREHHPAGRGDRIKRANGRVTKRGYDAMYLERATSTVKKARLVRVSKPALDPVLTTEAIEAPEPVTETDRVMAFCAQLDAAGA